MAAPASPLTPPVPDMAPVPDPVPVPVPANMPIQARISALSHSPDHFSGTITEASATLATATVSSTLNMSDGTQWTKIWDQDFTTHADFGPLSRHWGNVYFTGETSQGLGEAVLKSSASTNWANAGMMQPPTGASANQGYGLYVVVSNTDDSEGPGPYACLWPSTDVWPGPELDLFEKQYQSNTSGYSTIHYADSKSNDGYDVYMLTGIDMHVKHTFAMDWESDHIALYIGDGSGNNMNLAYSTTSHVPKDYADGGQNEAFGVGMQPAWAASQQNGPDNILHVYDMRYYAPAIMTQPPPPPPPSGQTITGTSGDNILTGTSGNDTITGGKGNDTMTGGAGADDFVFSKGDGFDHITDFASGTDHLVFKGITSSQMSFKSTSSGLDVIYGPGHTSHVMLDHVSGTSLPSGDILFQ
jgi:Ca2+-binding RTX toxin-like protein